MSRTSPAFPLLILTLCLLLPACTKQDAPATPAVAAPAGTVDLLFVYGSEKKKWIDDATAEFNTSHATLPNGKTIAVQTTPMGSGEAIDAALSGRLHPHLLSPASAAFIKLANATARTRGDPDLIAATDNLVLSPVVIAMWKPMAQALGWKPDGPNTVGWADILALSQNPQGWAAKGHPEWGPFRFGHTHPEYSNSGLISVIAETYAAAGKTRNLSPDDLAKPAVASFLLNIEKSVVHYGSSTGFFADKMFANGPRYLSAAVLYESNVVDSYASLQDPNFPVVAIYPKEGTFWSDHPVGIVQRDWVTPEHKQAADLYIKFLLSPTQQKKALTYGFRPADPQISLNAPLDKSHGIDPQEPKTLLEIPSPAAINDILALWRDNKKHANVILVLDTSGSMSANNKMAGAKAGAAELINLLSDHDSLSIVPFSTDTRWAARNLPLKSDRATALTLVNGLLPEGNTRLFNSIADACDFLQSNPAPDKISAVVVLTDGADTAKAMTLQQLLDKIHFDAESHTTRVFTIGYGSEAQAAELKKIAEQTQAKYYEGKPENIREVFKEIATFF